MGIVALLGGTLLILAGLLATPGSAAAQVTSQSVALHNNTASGGSDCPANTSVAYWHFVIAPNNGSFAFLSMTLNLGSANPSYTVSGGAIIPNGGQQDNVFVAVPGGSALTDLKVSGSSAVITPDGGSPKFNLSHTCGGGTDNSTTSSSTTSTTWSTTSTTEAPTTSSSSTTSSTTSTSSSTTSSTSTTTSTTEAPTTSSSSTTTTTDAPTTSSSTSTSSTTTTTDPGTTSTSVASLTPVPPPSTPPTTATPTVAPPASLLSSLPVTGSNSTSWLELGGFMILFGLTLLTLARRRTV